MALMLIAQLGLLIYLLYSKRFKQAGALTVLFSICALIFFAIFSFAASSF